MTSHWINISLDKQLTQGGTHWVNESFMQVVE